MRLFHHGRAGRLAVRAATGLVFAGLAAGLMAAGAGAEEGDEPTEVGALAPLTFTDAEARRGQAIYGASCARCHGGELGGMDGPPLIGANFEQRYSNSSAAEFLVRIRTTMPADAPGGLPAQQYLNLVAFLAQANGAEAGEIAIPADEELLATMSFLPVTPAE